jgi:hypothetical protein
MSKTADTVEPCPSKDRGTEIVGAFAGLGAAPGATARHVATDRSRAMDGTYPRGAG